MARTKLERLLQKQAEKNAKVAKRQAEKAQRDAVKLAAKQAKKAERLRLRKEKKSAKYRAKWGRKRRRKAKRDAKLARHEKWKQRMQALWARKALEAESGRATGSDFHEGQALGIQVADKSKAFQEGFSFGFELRLEQIMQILREADLAGGTAGG